LWERDSCSGIKVGVSEILAMSLCPEEPTLNISIREATLELKNFAKSYPGVEDYYRFQVLLNR